jgi:hypothetical protein
MLQALTTVPLGKIGSIIALEIKHGSRTAGPSAQMPASAYIGIPHQFP